MGIKEKMMERMIDRMSNEDKRSMMTQMMDKFFSSMTAKEKKDMMNAMMPKMMENMFKDMSTDDKQKLMSRMMLQMFGDKEYGMQMMKGMMGDGMMKMMEKCMSGEITPPWISMERAFEKATDATEFLLCTNEIHTLFRERVNELAENILKIIKETSDPTEIANRLKLSEESVYFLICKLAQDTKVRLKVLPIK
jgi:hypothetical protein